MSSVLENTTAVILCGGRGMQVEGRSQPVPKALVKVGGRALVWHVMRRFSMYGVRRFVLALGSGGEEIREYFIRFAEHQFDLKLNQRDGSRQVLGHGNELDWEITFVNTGERAGTGARVARCQQHLPNAPFFVTYADCLSNIGLEAVARAHAANKRVATVTGVKPVFRYGEFQFESGEVTAFSSTSRVSGASGYLNGGYMMFNPEITRYLDVMDECVIEGAVFSKLVAERQLALHPHDGFWYAVDTQRDLTFLEQRWLSNESDWLHF